MSARVGIALFDSVTGQSFGPAFDTEDDAEDFLDWLREKDGRDPRSIDVDDLVLLKGEWEEART